MDPLDVSAQINEDFPDLPFSLSGKPSEFKFQKVLHHHKPMADLPNMTGH